MTYQFETTTDHKVIVKLDEQKIDEVGAFESAESANYWASEMTKKYKDNPTFVYPGEEPEASIEE